MTGVVVRDEISRERLSLAFAGLAGGGGELTWGQRFVWDILQSLAPVNHYLNIRFRVHLPGDATRERVLGALQTLVRRHESLRTRVVVGPAGEPRQQADRAGELPVEFCETDPGGVRRLAEQEEDRLWRESFRHAGEWPLRVTVIVVGGRPRQVVFVFSHLAADGWGCWVFREEFLSLLRGRPVGPAPGGWQPRDRAAFEGSAAGRQANDRSLAYWRRVLETMPSTAFPIPRAPGERPLFPGVGLQSVALAAAARTVAARFRVGPAAVLLAALSAMIGARCGLEAVPLVLAAGNRFTPVDAASVGTFYQSAPALIRLDAGSLAGTVRNAHRASTLAYLRCPSDPRDAAGLAASVRARRGVNLDLASTVNVVPEPGAPTLPSAAATVAELREMVAATRVSDLEGRDSERLTLYVHVKSLHSRAVVELFCDSRCLPAAAARTMLAGLELVLIELLEAGDLSLGRVAEVAGIAPVARPSSYALVDHCWIDRDAVRRLVEDLPATVAAHVFRAEGDRLIAYVVAAEPTTPESLHAELLDRLDGHLTMTPHWYVICAGAPARLDSRAGWERQPVLRQGSGRPGETFTDPSPEA